MNKSEVLDTINKALCAYTGDDKELLEALCLMSDGWHDRLQELQDEDEDDTE